MRARRPATMPPPAGRPDPGASDLGADAMKPWLIPILGWLLPPPAAQAADTLTAFPPRNRASCAKS